MNKPYKILDSRWWTPPLPGQTIMDLPSYCIGAVAVDSYKDDWKVYMGFGFGVDEESDCQQIAQHGMPIGSREAACGLFPQLDPGKFRY